MTNDLQHIGGAWSCFINTVEADTTSITLNDQRFPIHASAASYWHWSKMEWMSYHDTLAYAERGREPL